MTKARPRGLVKTRASECERLRRRFGEYIEGWLSPASSVALERHLEGCIACRALLTRAHRKREAFNGLLRDVLAGDASAPQRLKEELRACIHCVSAPGSVRCPRLRTHLRLVSGAGRT